MNKFKIGDKVRIYNAPYNNHIAYETFVSEVSGNLGNMLAIKRNGEEIMVWAKQCRKLIKKAN
jgi:hypothetical protein